MDKKLGLPDRSIMEGRRNNSHSSGIVNVQVVQITIQPERESKMFSYTLNKY
jgi:hypothetical protein